MKLPSRLNSVIDAGGLILALVVDIVLGTICYLKIAPDPITAVALVAMGVTAVLFIFRSLSKRVYWAWAVIDKAGVILVANEQEAIRRMQ